MPESCKTKYPILLVHGAGFRDFKRPIYWGRIPDALIQRGATVYYGQQDGWGTTESNARDLISRIDEILAETGAEKVNIIGHSKGGLDARMAASSLGYGDKIASITTVATPHRGMKWVDRLMGMPKVLLSAVAFVANTSMKILGDKRPDFLKVYEGFTPACMDEFNQRNPDVPDVFYQSYACVMNHPLSALHLSTANFLVNRLEGPNDGIVSEESALWGENARTLRSDVFRGISHYDAIDLRRRPFSKKSCGGVRDICDVYVEIVSGLKERGL
ncbi:MAG TPA: alpha/beta fold hydrolase [Papillibacter sp.]|jgi:triacylglycerol lipase|nr:alpha/beta fold hydrolase [Papillibacter sp.]